jgi:outer membrane autotransporter protein
MLAAGSAASQASPGCTAVNGGAFSGNIGNQPVVVTDFYVGDLLTIVTATNQTGQTRVLAGQQVLAGWPMPANSGVQETYTIPDASIAALVGLQFRSVPPGGSAFMTTSCTPAQGPGPGPGPSPSSSDASQAVTKGFLLSRINGILLDDPGSTSLLNRDTGQSGPMTTAMAGNATNVASNGGMFGGAMGLGDGLGRSSDRLAIGNSHFDDADAAGAGSQNIRFSGSMSQMRRDAAQSQMGRDRMALGAGDGGALPLAYETASPWDIWVEGRYSAFDDDAGNLDRDGHVGVLYVGSDYRVTQNMIVGVLAQFDWAKDDSSVLASKVDGNGWMIGPYLSAQIHENIYFDLRAAWGRSNNDLTLDTVTAGFDTSRWLVKGALAGNWYHDAWRITPSAELAYVEESADAFTNSAGTFVAGQDVALGRLQFGPEFGYRIRHSADTFIEPFAAIKGVWDFDNPNVAIIDGFVVGPGDFWGRLEGGLNVMTSGGTYVRGSASWDGVGSNDYSGYTLQGTVNVPLN